MIVGFIDEQRAKHRAVGSICKVLREQGVPVAARTYRAWKHAGPSVRDMADAVVIDVLRAKVGKPEGMYGRRKMTAHLRREGFPSSKRQVDRLMRQLGMNGLVRGKGVRTTVADPKADRAPDLLDRDFTAPAPNRRWVADFTYVRTWAGFVYVSFVIDCFSRTIVGWHAATTKTTPLVTTALRMALWRRDRAGHAITDGLIHHSDAGSQGGFNWSSQHSLISEVFKDGDGGLEQEDERCARGGASAVACRSGASATDALTRAA